MKVVLQFQTPLKYAMKHRAPPINIKEKKSGMTTPNNATEEKKTNAIKLPEESPEEKEDDPVEELTTQSPLLKEGEDEDEPNQVVLSSSNVFQYCSCLNEFLRMHKLTICPVSKNTY